MKARWGIKPRFISFLIYNNHPNGIHQINTAEALGRGRDTGKTHGAVDEQGFDECGGRGSGSVLG